MGYYTLLSKPIVEKLNNDELLEYFKDEISKREGQQPSKFTTGNILKLEDEIKKRFK